jgi:hypothetical protein
MAKFEVTVDGTRYEVDAADEDAAWSQAYRQHQTRSRAALAPAPAAAPAPAPSTGRVTMDDTGRAQILNQELRAAQQRLSQGDPRAQGDVNALLAEFARMPAQFRPTGLPAPAPAPAMDIPTAAEPPAAPPPPAEVQSAQGALPAQQLGRQLGLTARAGAEGLASLAGVVTDPIAAVINQFVPPERRLSTLRSVVGTLLTQAGVPEPETAVERVVQQAAQSMAGAQPVMAAGRLAAATGGPVAQAVGGQLAALPLAQTTSAAGAGGAAQTAAEMGAGPAAQLAAGLAGGVAGGVAGTTQRVPGQAAQDIAAARQAGVRLMTTDVSPPRTLAGRAAERVGEAIPITGMTGPRTAQQSERVRAVQQLLDDFGLPSTADDFSARLAANVERKRGIDIARLSRTRNNVLERLDSAGAVPMTKTQAAANAEVARLSKAAGDPAVDRVIADLQDFATNAQGKSLQGVELLRKGLATKYADPSLANVKSLAEKSVNRLYSTVVDDMGDFIKANGQPNDFTKWKTSNAQLASMADELNVVGLKNTLNKGDVTPEVVDRLLFSNQPSAVKVMYRNLSNSGREVARAALLKRAADNARQLGERGAEGMIDPTTFAREVDKLSANFGVMFKPDDMKRIDGLVRVLNLTRRAAETQTGATTRIAGIDVPLSGVQAAGGIAVTAPIFGYLSDLVGPIPAAAVTGAGALSIGALARVYESAPVRNLLRQIADTRPGSREEILLLGKLSGLKVPAPQQEQK